MISQTSAEATLSASGHRFWQIALALFFLTCFLEFSRVLDLVHVHVIAAVIGLLAVAVVASKRAWVFWKCGAGRVLPLVIGWFGLVYVLSPHTELSLQYVLSCVEGSVLFLAAAGLVASVADFQKLFRVMAVAGLILCALGIVWSGTMNGRFALRGGPYADPNTYAMALLGIAPVIWVAFRAKPLLMRLGTLLATILPVLLALRTISRGGFVAMLIMLAVLFFLSSVRVKVAMASVVVLAVIVMLAFLPESVRTRLASAARLSSPVGSTDSVSVDSRETMLMTSINVSLAYPLLGVGPGNFGPTIAEFGKMQGQDWINLNTHNSYTQISSETGFPGLLLYLLMIGFSLKSLLGTLRRSAKRGTNPDVEIHRLSAGLLVSLAATLTCMFFLSEGYSMLNFLWLGLANGLRLLLPEDPKDEEEFSEAA